MDTKRQEVEKEIIESAKKLFIKNGFKGTTMRNIATEAGVNLAMLNYYFRSKENLFDIIFSDVFNVISSNIIPVMVSDMCVVDKIRAFVNVYIDGLIKNSDIPGFIFQEVFINPSRLISKLETKPEIVKNVIQFQIQLKEEADNGLILPIEDPSDLLINIISMCAFPFIAKPIVKKAADWSDEEYELYMTERKKSVSDFIVSAISI